MKQKMFNTKKLEPRCEYCLIGIPSPDGESVVCEKRGIMLPASHCRSYIYDALKRNPQLKQQIPQFSKEDFSLDMGDEK